MMKYIKKVLIGLMAVLFMVVPAAVVYGASSNNGSKVYVTDNAGILTDSEEAKLTKKCETASKNCKTDIVIMTTRTGLDYTELDNYVRGIINESYGYGDETAVVPNADATVYVIDMVSRADRIITSGRAKDEITQSKLDSIRSDAEDELADGNYYDGCVEFINGMNHQLTTSIWDKITYGLWIKLLIAAGVTVVVLVIMVFNTKAKMTANSRTYQKNVNIINRQDQYINTTITTRRIERSNSSGGGGGGGNSGSSGGHF